MISLEEATNRIDAAFRAFTTARDPDQYSTLLSPSATASKLYEAFVLTKDTDQN